MAEINELSKMRDMMEQVSNGDIEGLKQLLDNSQISLDCHLKVNL